ncbi:MAG: FkbM family methyltransferase [Selenomonadaceae bacterium]|nr:FkbM family methyltransferase [Selenomonadaceae bacterium]
MIAAQKFIEWGIEPIINDNARGLRERFNFYLAHLEDIFRIYKDLIDDESRETLLGFILQWVSRRVSFCKFAPQSQYLLNGFLPQAGDIMIDGGACDGATAAFFTDLGCKVYSFEMSKKNFADAKKLADEKGFILENLGLADFPREIEYKQGGGASRIYFNQLAPDGSPKTQLTTLDAYVREKNLPSVDFIKLDIEGAELAMLKGSVDTITRFKPKLALSAYHKPEDLWTLIDFVRSIRPDYEFAFRHFEASSDNEPFLFLANPHIVDFCKKFDLPMRYSAGYELVLFAR